MYAYQVDVMMPVEMYDRVHAEVEKRLGGLAEQCLVHLVIRIEGGFRVLDVWTSHEAADRFGDEVMRPVIESIAGPEATDRSAPLDQELDVYHLQVNQSAVTTV